MATMKDYQYGGKYYKPPTPVKVTKADGSVVGRIGNTDVVTYSPAPKTNTGTTSSTNNTSTNKLTSNAASGGGSKPPFAPTPFNPKEIGLITNTPQPITLKDKLTQNTTGAMPSGNSSYGGGVVKQGNMIVTNPYTGKQEIMQNVTPEKIAFYNKTVDEQNSKNKMINIINSPQQNLYLKDKPLDGKISQQDNQMLTTLPIVTKIKETNTKQSTYSTDKLYETTGYSPNKLYGVSEKPLYTPEQLNQRKEQLAKAGFNKTEIETLTGFKGESYTYYNGKQVPQTDRTKIFYESANQESLAKEKMATDTAIAGGIVGLGLIPSAIVGAPALLAAGGQILAGWQGTQLGQATGNPFTNIKPESGEYTQQQAARQGFINQEKNANKDIGSTLFNTFVPGAQTLDKDNFVKGTQDYLINEKGYAPAAAFKEANAIYERWVVGGAMGEVGGMILSSGGVEIAGRTFTKQALKDTTIKAGTRFLSKEGQKIATQSGFAIAKGGAIEGFGFYDLDRKAKLKEFNVGDAAFSTVGGAVSAGVIGGALVTGGLTNPKTAKWAQRALYLTDPTEKPGDSLADVTSSLLGQNFHPSVKVTTIVPTNTKSNNMQTNTKNTLIWGNTKSTTSQNSISNVPNQTQTTANLFNNTNTKTNTIINTDTKTNTKTNTKTDTQTNNNIITNTPENTNTNENTNEQTNENTNEQTNENTNEQTNSNTNTNTNTFTGLPILPFPGFGIGDASGGRSKRFGVKNVTKFKSLFGIPAKQKTFKNKKIAFIKQPAKNKYVAKQTNSFLNFQKNTRITSNKSFLPSKQKSFLGTKNKSFFNKKPQYVIKINQPMRVSNKIKPLFNLNNKPKQTSFLKTTNQKSFFNNNSKNSLIKKVRLL